MKRNWLALAWFTSLIVCRKDVVRRGLKLFHVIRRWNALDNFRFKRETYLDNCYIGFVPHLLKINIHYDSGSWYFIFSHQSVWNENWKSFFLSVLLERRLWFILLSVSQLITLSSNVCRSGQKIFLPWLKNS